jgi:hypothetical protein
MAHTFLLEPGRWTMQGSWLERNGMPISLKGMTLVAWNRDNWFTMATKLIFIDSDRPDISFLYKGVLMMESVSILFYYSIIFWGRLKVKAGLLKIQLYSVTGY